MSGALILITLTALTVWAITSTSERERVEWLQYDDAVRRLWHPSMGPRDASDRAEIVCAYCGMRVLIVRVNARGVPVVHGVTLVDQLGAHDRECAGRVA